MSGDGDPRHPQRERRRVACATQALHEGVLGDLGHRAPFPQALFQEVGHGDLGGDHRRERRPGCCSQRSGRPSVSAGPVFSGPMSRSITIFSVKYLDGYMAMIAWKEDTRYMGPRWQMADVLRTVTQRRTLKNLCGYWQKAAERIEDQVWTPGEKAESPGYLR